MTDYDIPIAIREIQHYAYCPHRWGLIHIGCDWTENQFVNKAKLLHENVDDRKSRIHAGVYTEHSVQVYNDELNVFGILDCLCLTPDDNGCFIEKYGARFRLSIIEYKPSSTKKEEAEYADRMQLLAQKICVDAVFQTDCDVYIYYSDIRRRRTISFAPKDSENLKKIINSIKESYRAGLIPLMRKSQYCGGCSMKDICLPKAGKRNAKIT